MLTMRRRTRPNMSRSSRGISAGIFGVFAVSLMFGAVQLASGRDLAEVGRGTSAARIHRVANADPAAGAQSSIILVTLGPLARSPAHNPPAARQGMCQGS